MLESDDSGTNRCSSLCCRRENRSCVCVCCDAIIDLSDNNIISYGLENGITAGGKSNSVPPKLTL